ncbi:nucleoid-structuring protein H-NS [Pseudomonas ogarae]|uniref:Nucleoid-structuring protein H-NS n=2 Tax=Pseudomonas TaxID=286 RepID=A0A0F4XQR6_9PSED|nr:nucleoid-structuring protein H-NS [Pseudomonas ogarae]
MAQRGYPGIHAGMPTAQCLRSAIVVNGALQIKIKIKGEAA